MSLPEGSSAEKKMNNKKFYRFGDNSHYTRGYTWAYSIISRSEVYESRCKKCGSVAKYPIGDFDVIVEGGVKYPDVLGCGAYPFLIVSEVVVNDWFDAGITCFTKYNVGVAEVKSKKLVDVPKPNYYSIEIEGRCKIDLDASGLKIKRKCGVCGNMTTKLLTSDGFKMVPNSWDGSDLFRDIDLYPRVSLCTEKVMKLAGENQRTNFRFEPMEGPRESFSKGIDYLKLYKKRKSK